MPSTSTITNSIIMFHYCSRIFCGKQAIFISLRGKFLIFYHHTVSQNRFDLGNQLLLVRRIEHAGYKDAMEKAHNAYSTIALSLSAQKIIPIRAIHRTDYMRSRSWFCGAAFYEEVAGFCEPELIANSCFPPMGKRAVVQRLDFPGRGTCHLTHVPLYGRNAG